MNRGGSTWRPQVTPTGQLPQPNSPYLQTVTKTSLAHKQLESQHVGCGYNNAAKPFVSILSTKKKKKREQSIFFHFQSYLRKFFLKNFIASSKC